MVAMLKHAKLYNYFRYSTMMPIQIIASRLGS